jgi:hypothetical protein
MGTIFLIVLFFCLFTIILIGLVHKPRHARISIIPTTQNQFNKICVREKTSCNSDEDCMINCVEANEGESMVCKRFPDTPSLTKIQKAMLGTVITTQADLDEKPPGFCVPENAKLSCNTSTGGIPIFSGWGGGDTMGFECLCAYPLWASSRKCKQNEQGVIVCEGNCLLNPDVCRGGTFSWDLTKNPQEPTADMCRCKDGDTKIVDNSGIPRCVPESLQNFYTDLEFTTENVDKQRLIQLDNIPGIKFVGGKCSEYTSSSSTTCDKGCCPLPSTMDMFGNSSVCCPGADFCCSASFPICDVQNRRCLKNSGYSRTIPCNKPGLSPCNEKCCPEGFSCDTHADSEWKQCVRTGGSQCDKSETECSGGCCRVPNATCCEDGANCCPPSFPICDSDRKACNPILTPLVHNTVTDRDTSCPNGTCPISDGICCGDGKHCCPPEYPICDPILGCRKSP